MTITTTNNYTEDNYDKNHSDGYHVDKEEDNDDEGGHG